MYEFPVSPAQARLLVLDRLYPGTAQYNVPAGFSVHGPLDVPLLTRALDTLVTRHESLRTVFRPGADGTPVQLVAPQARAAVNLERGAAPDGVLGLMLAEAARPFDTAEGPLLRCTVYQVEDGSHRVLLVAHHIICDGWSLQLMLRELSASYLADRAGTAAEPRLQYPDFAAWQCERLAAGGYAQAVSHWADSLRGAPTTSPLPVDLPVPPSRTVAGGVERFVLTPGLRTRLDKVARDHGGTSFMALFAAYAAFLGRLSGRTDLVVGVPVSGRDRADLQDMVGMLTNTLAVRVDLSGGVSYGGLIDRVRAGLLAGQDYQEAPFEAVVDAVAPDRTAGHGPLVQATFAYDDDTELELVLPGAEVRRVPLPLPVAKFDLLLYVERWGEDLMAQFIYSADLLAPDTVRRWVDNFRTLLGSLTAAPDEPVAAAEILPAAELAGLLREADHTGEAATAGTLVPDLVAARAAERPDAVAMVSGRTVLTYRHLLQQADALAARLVAAGVGPEVPVGLLLPRSAEMGVAALAVLRAGGAYVPLDTGNPAARLAHMVTDSGARLLIASAPTAGAATELGVPVIRMDVPGDDCGPLQPVQPLRRPEPGNVAYILYTSGSTGTPKGVAVEHRALANLCLAVRPTFPVGPDDRVLQYVNFGFDVAVSDLFFSWTAGAELHIAGADERLGEGLLTRLRDSRISYVFMPPSAAMSVPHAGGLRLPDLRTLAVGGEAVPAELVERWATPGRRILDAYGPSEATVYSTTAELAPGDPVVIGRPVPGARVHVLDAELRPVPVGVAGEVYVAGVLLARGYARRPGLTADRFVPDPYGPPGSRMYRTGDLGRRDTAGVLSYLGRVDTQVKVRGFRIELGEIENVLAGHPDVATAAAAVHGAVDDRHVVAYVVAAAGRRPDSADLRAHLAEQLPPYMLPDRYFRIDSMPLNRSGKIDRARLPDSAVVTMDPAGPAAGPATPTERRVTVAWAQVLGHDRIGPHDNFFDLGGNSIRLLAVLGALRADAADRTDAAGSTGSADRGLVLVDLFRHPTVSALAAHLDRTGAGPDSALVAEAARRGRQRRARLTVARNHRTTPTGGITS
ncbi:amino acid adenylation domain-containing protein [Streptomyces sp. NPDC005571]|uniref:non-ribosomal peptide synthetase n=1 Tax=Streptomyces sp. NPDC005571 TaxID=3156888 RepID=UPI0033AB36E2